MITDIASRLESGIDCPARETIRPPVLLLDHGGPLHRDVRRSLGEAGWPVAWARLKPVLPRTTPRHRNRPVDAAIAQALAALDQRPAHAVVMLGDELRAGRLLDRTPDELPRVLAEAIGPQLQAARHLLPMLAANSAGSTYLVLGGPAAESPWYGYGCQSVASATLRSLVQVLQDEMSHTRVRVRQLSVCTPIRSDSNRDRACPNWPNTLEVGHRIAGLLDAPGEDTVIRLARR